LKTRAGGVAQVVKCLPSNEALSSNPGTPKKKKLKIKEWKKIYQESIKKKK
jgi:hypothetical protein